jgi:hypothetical protein
MCVKQVDRLSNVIAGASEATYEMSIAVPNRLTAQELHQLRLDIDRAYAGADTVVEDLWIEEPGNSMKDRRWNLNEEHGYLLKTNLPESRIDLRLGLKKLTGNREEVGRYLLDLESLAQSGFVTRRVVGNNRVFDLRINRDTNGEYTLELESGPKAPLDDFRVEEQSEPCSIVQRQSTTDRSPRT